MPRKKEILEDQEAEVLTLAAPEEAAEVPDFPAGPPETHEEMSSESPAEDSGEPVDDPPGQDVITSEK